MQIFAESMGLLDSLMQILGWAFSVVGFVWEWLKVGFSLVWAVLGSVASFALGLVGVAPMSLSSFIGKALMYLVGAILTLYVLAVLFGLFVPSSKDDPERMQHAKRVKKPENPSKPKEEPRASQQKIEEYRPEDVPPQWMKDGRIYTTNPGSGSREI